MIRRFFLLVFLLAIPISVFAQSIFWEEPFDVDNGDWTLESNWAIVEGALTLAYSPVVEDYDLSATSPVLTLPDNVGDLVVNQYFNSYTSAVDEVIEVILVTTDGDVVVWDYDTTIGDWGTAEGEDLILPLGDYAGEEVQIKFRSFGSTTFNFDWWSIFNVAVYQNFDTDLAAVEVIGRVGAEQNVENTWSVLVRNVGMETITGGYTVSLFRDGDIELGSTSLTDDIEPGSYLEYDFAWTPTEIEATYLYGTIALEGDQCLENDRTDDFSLMIYEEGLSFVLIWDNDNNSHFTDPQNGVYTNCEQGLIDRLVDNGCPHVIVNQLPGDLTVYDIVFIELGLYCVG